MDQPVVEVRKQPGVDVAGLTSRWDYGAEGSRKGLLFQMKERLEEAKADFLVLLGGIVSQEAVYNTARKLLADQKLAYLSLKAGLDNLKKEVDKLSKDAEDNPQNQDLAVRFAKKLEDVEKLKKNVLEAKPKTLKQLVDAQVEVLAQQINSDLPKLYRSDGSRMKVYIVTSKAYDGDVGRDVVKRLLELRRGENDLRYLSNKRADDTTFRIPLQKSGKTFAVIVPNKAAWRSKYYSTYPDRLLEDEAKRTSQPLCDVYAVGCFASSINRPDGEIPYQRVTVPALHKLEDVITSENMVGIALLRFIPNERSASYSIISFKDLLSQERKFIKAPDGCSKVQLSVIDEIKNKGSRTIGMLEDALGIVRKELEKALEGLTDRKRAKAGLSHDEESQTYDFCNDWFQEMKYDWPPKDGWVKEVLLGYGCVHGGSIHTAYKVFVKELPLMIVEHGVKYLLALGDLIEGLKHNLALRGEVFGGMNNTDQEKVIAYMTAEVLLESLNLRLAKAVKELGAKKLSSDEVLKLLEEHMTTFLFWVGNHDDWARDLGYDPLDTFEATLFEQLEQGLAKILKAHNLVNVPVKEFLRKKVVRMQKNHPYPLPSGLNVDGAHYYAGRTATSSTWPQRALGQLRKAQLVWIANFHVAEIVQEWSAKLGLRVAVMLPTIKTKSDFEDNKGKITDFGFGLLKVWSHGGRVIVTETSFLGENPHESLSNKILVRGLLKEVGVGKWVDLDQIK